MSQVLPPVLAPLPPDTKKMRLSCSPPTSSSSSSSSAPNKGQLVLPAGNDVQQLVTCYAQFPVLSSVSLSTTEASKTQHMDNFIRQFSFQPSTQLASPLPSLSEILKDHPLPQEDKATFSLPKLVSSEQQTKSPEQQTKPQPAPVSPSSPDIISHKISPYSPPELPSLPRGEHVQQSVVHTQRTTVETAPALLQLASMAPGPTHAYDERAMPVSHAPEASLFSKEIPVSFLGHNGEQQHPQFLHHHQLYHHQTAFPPQLEDPPSSDEGVHSQLGDVLSPLSGKKRKRWNPEDMDHAIALVEEKRMSARSAALLCHVPRSTLWDRLSQRSSYQGRSKKVRRRRNAC